MRNRGIRKVALEKVTQVVQWRADLSPTSVLLWLILQFMLFVPPKDTYCPLRVTQKAKVPPLRWVGKVLDIIANCAHCLYGCEMAQTTQESRAAASYKVHQEMTQLFRTRMKAKLQTCYI